MHPIRQRLRILPGIFFVVMILGTVGFALTEKKTLIEAAYFVIVTVATIWYGISMLQCRWGESSQYSLQ
jgi:hypothetical protein